MVNHVEFGIFSRDDLDLSGLTVDQVYRLFDDVQRNLGGAVVRKRWIYPFVNGTQTSEDPLADHTIIAEGDEIEFRRIPPEGYNARLASATPPYLTQLKRIWHLVAKHS